MKKVMLSNSTTSLTFSRKDSTTYHTLTPCTAHTEFKRQAIELEDSIGNLSPPMMLQYIFNGDPNSLEIKPHGQAKKNPHIFFTTGSGSRAKFSEEVSSSLGPSFSNDHLR